MTYSLHPISERMPTSETLETREQHRACAPYLHARARQAGSRRSKDGAAAPPRTERPCANSAVRWRELAKAVIATMHMKVHCAAAGQFWHLNRVRDGISNS